jgi:hypothetical protein
MKRTFIITLITLTAFACNKEEKTVNEEDAVETVTNSMSQENAGLASQTEDAAKITEIALESPLCGVSQDTVIVKTYSSATRSLDYTFNWGWVVNCTSGVPSDITFDYSSNGVYDTPRISSDDNATATIVLTQLPMVNPEYLANITYTRNGTQDSKKGAELSFTSVITATGTDITINKETYEITGGTISVEITGTVEDGDSFEYAGDLVFNGGGSATITLANGNVYEITI